MDFSMRQPARMPYYAAMAALGSLAGCLWIYALARKAGEAYYRKKHEHAPGSVRKWVREFPLTSVLLPAVAPFPVPFKPFVIAQGVFQVPFGIFVIGTLAGRGALFLVEGFLGARYGAIAKQFIVNEKWPSLAIALGLVALYFAVRALPPLRRAQYSQVD